MGDAYKLTESQFLFGERELLLGEDLEAFKEIFGPWDREYQGARPPPVGFRNNHRYIYDSLGISLLDHWSDRCVRQITFHFSWERECLFCPRNNFTGIFRLLDETISAETAWDIARRAGIAPFHQVLKHIYSAEIGLYHMSLEFVRAGCQPTVAGLHLGMLSVSLKLAS